MTPALDPHQLASTALELLRSHWTLAAATVADGALKEAGKSIVKLLTGAFTTKAATATLEEAAESPADPDKSEALELQIKHAIKTNPQLAESISALIAALPEDARPRITQTGNKNSSIQITGNANKIS